MVVTVRTQGRRKPIGGEMASGIIQMTVLFTVLIMDKIICPYIEEPLTKEQCESFQKALVSICERCSNKTIKEKENNEDNQD